MAETELTRRISNEVRFVDNNIRFGRESIIEVLNSARARILELETSVTDCNDALSTVEQAYERDIKVVDTRRKVIDVITDDEALRRVLQETAFVPIHLPAPSEFRAALLEEAAKRP